MIRPAFFTPSTHSTHRCIKWKEMKNKQQSTQTNSNHYERCRRYSAKVHATRENTVQARRKQKNVNDSLPAHSDIRDKKKKLCRWSSAAASIFRFFRKIVFVYSTFRVFCFSLLVYCAQHFALLLITSTVEVFILLISCYIKILLDLNSWKNMQRKKFLITSVNEFVEQVFFIRLA